MKKLSLILLLLVLLIPAVSAEEYSGIIYDAKSESEDLYLQNTTGTSAHPSEWRLRYEPGTSSHLPSDIHIFDTLITCHPQPYADTFASIPLKREYFGQVKDGSTKIADVRMEVIKNDFHEPAYGGFTIILWFENWNIEYLNTITTVKAFTFDFTDVPTYTTSMHFVMNDSRPDLGLYLYAGDSRALPVSRVNLMRFYYPPTYFENEYTINIDELGTTIFIKRNFEQQNPSKLRVISQGSVIYESATYENVDRTYYFSKTNLTVDIITPTNTYRILENGKPVTEPDLEPVSVNIRVQNSQTGALLANAHVNISASVNGSFYEVVNETLPAGTKTYQLQPTGGGLPNPDFYRLIATVDDYNSIMPYIDFEADRATTIYAYLNPIGGAPADENKTFIDFYVRDLNANPVAGATVKFGAYTLLTNSAGYTIFEVDKDKTYSWTVSKSGYGAVTGNAVIGSNARYTINAVIAPAVTPTLTTPIPTSPTVGPTPTMTAPTGEPVSNLLEWFAAHFGMLLGGGVEIGKIFMWLCFTIPAGVFVGREAKAGAAGFMAGAGIVTLFFVIIGWVPIWLVVILALIIGLLYAKAFSNIGNGGGR